MTNLRFSNARRAAPLLAVLLLAGCGESQKPAGQPVAPAQAKPSGPSQPAPSVASAPADLIAAEIRAGQNAKGAVEVATIQKAIQQFQAEEGRNPASLAELVEKSYLKILPTPPAGRKLEYDAASATVKLVAE